MASRRHRRQHSSNKLRCHNSHLPHQHRRHPDRGLDRTRSHLSCRTLRSLPGRQRRTTLRQGHSRKHGTSRSSSSNSSSTITTSTTTSSTNIIARIPLLSLPSPARSLRKASGGYRHLGRRRRRRAPLAVVHCCDNIRQVVESRNQTATRPGCDNKKLNLNLMAVSASPSRGPGSLGLGSGCIAFPFAAIPTRRQARAPFTRDDEERQGQGFKGGPESVSKGSGGFSLVENGTIAHVPRRSGLGPYSTTRKPCPGHTHQSIDSIGRPSQTNERERISYPGENHAAQ